MSVDLNLHVLWNFCIDRKYQKEIYFLLLCMMKGRRKDGFSFTHGFTDNNNRKSLGDIMS